MSRLLLAVLALLFLNINLAGAFSQVSRVDIRIGDPPTCQASGVPADAETPCGWPTSGTITTFPFEESHVGLSAIDISRPDGEPIYASHDGTVKHPTPLTQGDIIVSVTSSKYITRYQHLLKRCVPADTHVTRGTLIGLMDDTGYSFGSHLHYDITRLDGSALSLPEFNSLVPPYDRRVTVTSSYAGPTTC